MDHPKCSCGRFLLKHRFTRSAADQQMRAAMFSPGRGGNWCWYCSTCKEGYVPDDTDTPPARPRIMRPRTTRTRT